MTPALSLDSREIALPNADATKALGARVGALMGVGDVVTLGGGLGAGKTTFARGAVSAWMGRDEETPSPTYTLVQTYEGMKGELWHADLYRLKTPDDALELGLIDAFADAACLIEWPEKIRAFLPADHLHIALTTDGEGRVARLEPAGAWRDRLDQI